MRQRLCSFVLLALLLSACGTDGSSAVSESSASAEASAAPATISAAPSTPAEPSAAPSPSPSPSPSPTSGPTPVPTPGPDEFVNPVIASDFPDPDVLKVGDTFYAYATNSGGVNVQTASSTDLVNWQPRGDAMPALPAWSTGLNTWAPEVTTSADGQTYLLYFTTQDATSQRQCIGVATASEPLGPFTAVGDAPLICPVEQGGAIDAGSFVDEDGSRYLLWKNDGNCCGSSTQLYLQPVSDDGLTLTGEAVELISNDQVWEGLVVEAPTLWKHDGRYYLFYSANAYKTLDYAVGYAVSDAIAGPYQKPKGPLLSTDYKTGAAFGPGGQDIVVDGDGETWMLYHSWTPDITMRPVLLDELVWENGTTIVRGPDRGPQPQP